jgi:3-oxoacyl-[acyl-carrier protein] reductase
MTSVAAARPLQGKVALVTGAAGLGIGTCTARRLAAQGARVYLNGLREEPLAKLAREIEAAGGSAEPIAADVGDPEEVERLAAAIHERGDGLDILVHNAARGAAHERVDRLSLAAWHEDLGVILTGAFLCTRALVGPMIARRSGRILFVSSSAGLRGSWGRAVSYAAAKAGLHGMTVRLALELGEFGITVNAVAPSQIDTPRARRGGRRTDASLREYARAQVPLGRVGEPLDVAALLGFLASDEASYLTGQIFVVDGGASLASRSTLPVDPPHPALTQSSEQR